MILIIKNIKNIKNKYYINKLTNKIIGPIYI